MKTTLKTTCIFLLLSISLINVNAQLPYLKKEKNVTQFIVDGKPFIMFSGELHNSSSSSKAYMEKVWPGIIAMNLNAVIASASWELVEPEEGKYSFEEVDHVIERARAEKMKVVLIWFASWKNGESTYVPEWVKTNIKKYPKVKTLDGRTLNVLSTFYEENEKADEKAYVELMKHIKAVDFDNTVIMMQVQNEVGILGSERDYSPIAEKAWKSSVPEDLISYLQKNKGKLFPELEKVWAANGHKTKGNWEEVFGKSFYPDGYIAGKPRSTPKTDDTGFDIYYGFTEEIFMAYYYAKYMGKMTEAGKKVHNIPAYVNAWLRQPGEAVPGIFPSGGPTAETLDIWRAAAPAVDFIAPDIYIDQYDWVLKEYTRSGNPLFIPECTLTTSKALYSYGEYDAICFAPFGFDGRGRHTDEEAAHLGDTYNILRNMEELIIANQGSDKMRGIMIDQNNPEQTIEMGEYIIKASPSARRRAINYGQSEGQLSAENAALARAQAERFTGGAIVIQTGKDEFIFVGYGLNLRFEMKDSTKIVDIASKDEGTFINNKFIPGRRLNGDELRAGLPEQTSVLKIRLYSYK